VEDYPTLKNHFLLNCPVKRPILKIDQIFNGGAGIFSSKSGRWKMGYPNRQLYDKIYGNVSTTNRPPNI
jgi:hypothetical protein